jgi:hypothetical protein
MPIQVSQPAALNRFIKDDHENHKIIVVNPTLATEDTQFGPAQVCRGDVICADCLKAWEGETVFGSVVAPRLGGTGQPVTAGILYKGKAKAGREAPWLINDLEDFELADVQALVNRVVTQLSSGKLVVDFDAFAFDNNDKKDL